MFKSSNNPLQVNKTRLTKIETEIEEKLNTLYSDEGRARLISVKIEQLASLIQKATMNRMS